MMPFGGSRAAVREQCYEGRFRPSVVSPLFLLGRCRQRSIPDVAVLEFSIPVLNQWLFKLVFINLTQIRDTQEEGNLNEELSSSD